MTTRADVLRWLDEVTHNEPGTVQPDTPLEGLGGWDSLANEEFRMIVEERLRLELDGLAVERSRTAADLLQLVAPALTA